MHSASNLWRVVYTGNFPPGGRATVGCQFAEAQDITVIKWAFSNTNNPFADDPPGLAFADEIGATTTSLSISNPADAADGPNTLLVLEAAATDIAIPFDHLVWGDPLVEALAWHSLSGPTLPLSLSPGVSGARFTIANSIFSGHSFAYLRYKASATGGAADQQAIAGVPVQPILNATTTGANIVVSWSGPSPTNGALFATDGFSDGTVWTQVTQPGDAAYAGTNSAAAQFFSLAANAIATNSISCSSSDAPIYFNATLTNQIITVTVINRCTQPAQVKQKYKNVTLATLVRTVAPGTAARVTFSKVSPGDMLLIAGGGGTGQGIYFSVPLGTGVGASFNVTSQ